MRGEYSRSTRFAFFKPGSPPLARGVPNVIRWIGWEIRITPACAGSTAVSIGSKCLSQDHPRLRGEYSACAKPLLRFWGSPPLARGVLTSLIMLLTGKRITPACAGSTRKRTGEFFLYGDHPRLRGEYK